MSRDDLFHRSNSFEAPSGAARDELEARLAALYAESDVRFHALVRAAGLRPTEDFRDRDLRALNFLDAELEGFDFSGSDLRGTGLRFAHLGLSTKLDRVLLDEEDGDWISRQDSEWPYWDEELFRDLSRAIASGKITVVYQPILSVKEAMILRVEALARWDHPTRGPVPASTFIPMLEEVGGIDRLGHVLLERVVEDQRKMRELGVTIGISVNMAAASVANRAFCEDCMRILAGQKADIRFEFTEADITIHRDSFRENLLMLRPFGIDIAIDDYGTSYSSLAELRDVGAREMKIDRSFIGSISSSPDADVLKSVIDLGHSLGMSVTAEGIESSAEAYCAKVMGCDDLQGFWVRRPLPFDDLIEFLHVSTIGGWSQKLLTLQPPRDDPRKNLDLP